MKKSDKLRKFIQDSLDEGEREEPICLDNVENGRDGARDLTLSYLYLGKVEKAKQWASVAVPDYLKYCRFAADHKLDPSSPPEMLADQPWADAVTAMELATFAADDDLLLSAAKMISEWASFDFLNETRGWENNLRVDAASILALFVLDESYSDYYESLQSKFDAMKSPDMYAKRDYYLANAVVGIATREVDQIKRSCKLLDEYHEKIDIYKSSPMEIVNIHSCFCIAFARQRGLDITYTSDYVPNSVESYS